MSRPLRYEAFMLNTKTLRYAICALPASPDLPRPPGAGDGAGAGDTYCAHKRPLAAAAAATAASPTRSPPVGMPSNLAVSYASHATPAACNTWTDSTDTTDSSRRRRCRHRRLSCPAIRDWTRGPRSVAMRAKPGLSPTADPHHHVVEIEGVVLRYFALIVVDCAALLAASLAVLLDRSSAPLTASTHYHVRG